MWVPAFLFLSRLVRPRRRPSLSALPARPSSPPHPLRAHTHAQPTDTRPKNTAAILGIAGATALASSADASFGDFIDKATLRDCNDFAGYEVVLKSSAGPPARAGPAKKAAPKKKK